MLPDRAASAPCGHVLDSLHVRFTAQCRQLVPVGDEYVDPSRPRPRSARRCRMSTNSRREFARPRHHAGSISCCTARTRRGRPSREARGRLPRSVGAAPHDRALSRRAPQDTVPAALPQPHPPARSTPSSASSPSIVLAIGILSTAPIMTHAGRAWPPTAWLAPVPLPSGEPRRQHRSP